MLQVGYYRRRNGKGNFGDDLSPLLIARITGTEVKHSGMMSADIVGVGSILDYWNSRGLRVFRNIKSTLSSKRPLAIWGTGLREPRRIFLPKSDILAVRGPLTAQHLGIRQTVHFADPGILAPIVQRPRHKINRIGIVPHYVDKENPVVYQVSKDPRFLVIDVEDKCERVLSQISQCQMILSSSLHGLICADAYGIPNGRLLLSNRVKGGDFKFRDYVLGVNRERMVSYPIADKSDVYLAADDLERNLSFFDPSEIEARGSKMVTLIREWYSENFNMP